MLNTRGSWRPVPWITKSMKNVRKNRVLTIQLLRGRPNVRSPMRKTLSVELNVLNVRMQQILLRCAVRQNAQRPMRPLQRHVQLPMRHNVQRPVRMEQVLLCHSMRHHAQLSLRNVRMEQALLCRPMRHDAQLPLQNAPLLMRHLQNSVLDLQSRFLQLLLLLLPRPLALHSRPLARIAHFEPAPNEEVGVAAVAGKAVAKSQT